MLHRQAGKAEGRDRGEQVGAIRVRAVSAVAACVCRGCLSCKYIHTMCMYVCMYVCTVDMRTSTYKDVWVCLYGCICCVQVQYMMALLPMALSLSWVLRASGIAI